MYPQADDSHNPETLERQYSQETGEREERKTVDVVEDAEGRLYQIVGNEKVGPLETREAASEDDSENTVLEVAIPQEDGTVEWQQANILPYSAENYESGSIYGGLELGDVGTGDASNPDRIRTDTTETPNVEAGAEAPISSLMGSFENSISQNVKELDPDNHQEATADEYRATLLDKLNSISETLRFSGRAVEQLLVGGEAMALATARSELLSDIEGQISEASDKATLENLERRFLQGSGDTDTENISSGLSIDPSLAGFNLALARINTVPALMEFQSGIVTGREKLKAKALAAEQLDEPAAHKAYGEVAEALGAEDPSVISEFLHGDEKPEAVPTDDNEMKLAA
ncbi:MAG: hypothetical protein LBL84_02740 [Candidatus Nomurabacteria bacterium]|nr:hypothetical protein [Candidatus Nomurabacteria bacterium]